MTSDEELDLWDLVHIAGEHRKNRRGGFFIFTLVEGIDDDEGWNADGLKWTNNDLLHLGNQRVPSNSRVGPQDLQQLLLKLRIPIGELKCKCWQDRLNVTPVLEISQAEEACPKFSLRKGDLRERLGDCRLSGPRKAVEPENPLALLILQPIFELSEDIPPCPPQTPLSVP